MNYNNKNNKFYKMAQAIDCFDMFMPEGNVVKDLIDPVRKGECSFNERAEEMANYIWECMNYDTNPEWIKENGLAGKKKYYPEGKWINNHLFIDVKGEDAGLKDFIKVRLMNFECMLYEDYLKESLNDLELFTSIKEATSYQDRIYKIDLIARDYENEVFNISVYKSTDETALYKLNNSKKAREFQNRLSYNVNKSGDPRDPENVLRWFNEIVEDHKHIIYLNELNKFKIS